MQSSKVYLAILTSTAAASVASAANINTTVNWDGGAGTTAFTTQANWVEEALINTVADGNSRIGPVNGTVIGGDTYYYDIVTNVAGSTVNVNIGNQLVRSFTIGSASNAVTVTTNGGSSAFTLGKGSGDISGVNTRVLGNSVLDISYNGGWRLSGSANANAAQLTFDPTATIRGSGKIVFWNSQAIQGGTYNINLEVGNDFSSQNQAGVYNLLGDLNVGSHGGVAKGLSINTAGSEVNTLQTLNTQNHSITLASGFRLGEKDKRGDAGNQSSYAAFNAGTSLISVGGDLSILSDADGVNKAGVAQKRDSHINAGVAHFKIGGSFGTNGATNKWYGDATAGTTALAAANAWLWNTDSTTFEFNGGGTSVAPRVLELMSEDRGGDGTAIADWTRNFSVGSLILSSNTYLKLQDLTDNFYTGAAGSRVATPNPEALYLTDITIGAGSTLDLNGLKVYYSGTASLEGNVVGGSLITIPEPAGIAACGLFLIGAMGRRRRS